MLEALEPLPEEEDYLCETPDDKILCDNAPVELKNAENRFPNSKFVKGCREFYIKRGFLSEKQRRALDSVSAPTFWRRSRN